MKQVKPVLTTMIVLAFLVTASVAGAQTKALAKPRTTGAEARIPQARPVSGIVNLNTAVVADLVLLPKVGDAVAQRIVEYRDKNGAFKKVEDLLNVKGIGEKSFESLRPYLTLTGQTTIKVVQ
ncbi:MAG: helix-hairpin-helix domain-containing protein [Acidobacteriota bacterium]